MFVVYVGPRDHDIFVRMNGGALVHFRDRVISTPTRKLLCPRVQGRASGGIALRAHSACGVIGGIVIGLRERNTQKLDAKFAIRETSVSVI